MRLLIQRVGEARVEVAAATVGAIGRGMLLLVGIEGADDEGDAAWLAAKAVQLRIFPDEAGLMNRSVRDVGGDILAVSQFTLFAASAKGNRPSFIRAARPEQARPLYERFCAILGEGLGRPPATGVFGADMQVHLVNDGPVTIWLDSRARDYC